MYRVVIIAITQALPILKEAFDEYSSFTAIIVLFLRDCGARYERETAKAPQSKNTMPTRSRKGISGHNWRITTEKIKDPIPATSALFAVAFFQNNPSIKITTIPGVKKPVNS
tara:strand:- start:40 stop:375 length:336 start_codon:yes stop_codon:yes gene_type:complete